MKKYEFTDETKELTDGTVLHRIRAARNFGGVKAGDLGGWIEKEDNLSHEGIAWVCDNARVYGNAWVFDDAWVSGDARVSGNARVYGDARVSGDAWVYGNALVSGDARVYGGAWVCGDARVSGDAQVSGNAWVRDNAWVYGDARVSGNAQVSGNARVGGKAAISKTSHYLVIGPIDSRNDFATFYRDAIDGIGVACGCFCGTLDEFLKKARETHGDDRHGRAYRAAAELAMARI